MNEAIENVKDGKFEEGKVTVLDFYADWCGPCQRQTPIIEKIAEENQETVAVIKINVDENTDLAEKYEVESIPSIFVIKNGKVTKKFIGLTSKEELLEAIK